MDGLVNLLAATADDLITELLFPVDGDGDGETDPFIRKILGAAPKRPPFVYRDTGYGGVNMKKMIIHKSRATDIITGGKSPSGLIKPSHGNPLWLVTVRPGHKLRYRGIRAVRSRGP